MAGENCIVIVNQERVGEAKLPDAVGDLPDLLPGMGSGIAGMRPQARDRHGFNSRSLDCVTRR